MKVLLQALVLMSFSITCMYINAESNLSYFLTTPMPSKSYFAGFAAPNDKVLKRIRAASELLEGDRHYGWLHFLADSLRSTENGELHGIKPEEGFKAATVMLGYRQFSEGHLRVLHNFHPRDLINSKNFHVPSKIVALGNFDENWGWLSTHITNRTNNYCMTLAGDMNKHYISPFDKDRFKYGTDYVEKFLDDPNLVMLFVNQHHNVTHPKVISIPLGVTRSKTMYTSMVMAQNEGWRKDTLIFSAGSNYGVRPCLKQCTKDKLGEDLTMPTEKIGFQPFHHILTRCMATIALPGMGYDTYRLWETLAAGGMPVVERGTGLERSYYRLPVLQLDDYIEIDAFVIKQAYVEALYRAEEWDYGRLTRRWWAGLISKAAVTGENSHVQRLHPILQENVVFTRPLVPFDCDAMGGCGTGTKLTPRKSCCIDPSIINEEYVWSRPGFNKAMK